MAFVLRREAGTLAYEQALRRAGFALVAGTDEAGRGACAGPLVAAAVILDARPSRRIDGLDDSKLLTPRQRERLYEQIRERAVAWSVVSLTPQECDALGMHVANLEALRRAVARLEPQPHFTLSDGFGVDGLVMPTLAVWKGDLVAACVSAASIVAKVTRDRAMVALAEQYPQYRFDVHKGYCTPVHQAALDEHGPSDVHRRRFVNVRRAARVSLP